MSENQVDAPQDSRYWVKSVARAAELLELLADQGGSDGLSVTQIGSSLGLSKSAVFAMLFTLQECGLVADQGAGMSRRYRLGMGLARLGARATEQTPLRQVARGHLEALARATGSTARLATFEDDHAVVIDQVGGNERVRLELRMGSREMPHSTGLGKAILAYFPAERVTEIVERVGMRRQTSRTITDLALLLENLAQIREAGYALDDEEDAEGVFCIGSAVLRHDGTCVGAISVTGLKLDQPAWRYEELGKTVAATARAVSRDLGYSALPVA